MKSRLWTLDSGLRALLVLMLLPALAGCESVGKPKVDNPVFGPAPPRKTMPEGPSTKDESGDDTRNLSRAGVPPGEVVPAGGFPQDGNTQAGKLSGTEIVAHVNGAPIFESEVLERYGSLLTEAESQMPPADFQKLRTELIKKDLKGHIERKLLVEALKATLKPEQYKALQVQLDTMFSREVERLKKEFKVNTKHELQIELKKQGTSLAHLRDAFAGQQMAREFLAAKSKLKRKISRQELLSYYHEHLDDYLVPGQVKWQQIVITHAIFGGKRAAMEALSKAVAELKSGADFGEVARKYSDGPTAENGGHWDWMQAGSLADKTVEQALFQLPVGMISQVFDGDDAYQIVKVIDRKEASKIPFGDVQAKIQAELEKQDQKQATSKVLEELFASAVVTTMFDDQEAGASNSSVSGRKAYQANQKAYIH